MLALAMVCWGLSLMSKEMAVTFPAVLFLWNYTAQFQEATGSWLRRSTASARAVLKREGLVYLGMSIVAVAYSYYAIVSQRASGRAGAGGLRYWGGSFYTNLLTEVRVQAWFLKQLVFPTPIAQYSGAFPISTSILDWKVVAAAVLILSIVGAGIFALGRSRLVSFAVLSYFVILLPASQIVPHRELLGDHYLYLPIFCFALLVSLGVKALTSRLGTLQRVVYAGSAAVLSVLVVLTAMQNAVWKDDRTFWERNYAEVPNSPRAIYSLAGQYLSLNSRKAQEMFRRLVALDPTYSQAYFVLAKSVNNKEDAQEIESLIQTALAIPDKQIELNGSDTPSEFRAQLKTSLATLKGVEGDQGAAESFLWEAVSLDPSNPQPYALLGQLYAKDKNKQMDILTKELAAIPDSISAREDLVFILIKDQKYDETIPYLNAILSINPNDVFANYQMGRIYLTKKDCPRARAHLKTAAWAATRSSDVSDVKDAMKQLIKDCGSE
jgi:tetratricopeptide (TPR) repeat protein